MCAFFVPKQISKLFSNYIQLCDFWRQNFVQKCVRKLLMKLTAGVNFINILREYFLYKSALRSFSLVKFWLWQKDFGERILAKKALAFVQ